MVLVVRKISILNLLILIISLISLPGCDGGTSGTKIHPGKPRVIEGIISDTVTGLPIANALISELISSANTTSDENGQFTLAFQSSGDDLLEVAVTSTEGLIVKNFILPHDGDLVVSIAVNGNEISLEIEDNQPETLSELEQSTQEPLIQNDQELQENTEDSKKEKKKKKPAPPTGGSSLAVNQPLEEMEEISDDAIVVTDETATTFSTAISLDSLEPSTNSDTTDVPAIGQFGSRDDQKAEQKIGMTFLK